MIRQPHWPKSLPSNIINGVSTLGPLGYWGKAPGTVGSAAGIIYYTLVFHQIGILGYLTLLAVTIYLAIAFCGEAEVRLMKKDPPEVILDEFVAIPVCFFGMGYLFDRYPVWFILLLGFILFRFFDILKPIGIKRLQELPGGWGVVIDDIAAAVATNIVLHVVFLGWWLIV
ncbi:MAG: phosphatidylglycerophosphatase A [Verrucomicrobia bacterium CG_4_10_14_0_8_um_filter_43_34]|nr:MAG: phosphatidylglycerophosphatase A [Verrucomicrobia bacterium CG1_02_43_26]PIP58853.1 MAG: phosphatidylglycerophosphatase A [Verrucomicrobia bacterium CG22_combo_CG10-13_8_21_14_all_43_17]PIY62051.1 MAG: phosphatidylglycerophosphatase A [Verrucomicrobia bacterium CG_4_10_14_0_8_um_filter_43_34]